GRHHPDAASEVGDAHAGLETCLQKHTPGAGPVEAVQDSKPVRGRPPGCERVLTSGVVLEGPFHGSRSRYRYFSGSVPLPGCGPGTDDEGHRWYTSSSHPARMPGRETVGTHPCGSSNASSSGSIRRASSFAYGS